MGLEELTRVARLAAEAGAATAVGWQHPSAGRTVREKAGPWDLVSQADLEAEKAIRHVLEKHRPDDAVLGEELGAGSGSTGITWVIDPIDGTTSYLYGRADWAVSVAARAADGQLLAGAVVEPAYDRTTWASRDSGTMVDGEPVSLRECGDLREALVQVNFGRREQHRCAGEMVDALLARVRDLRRDGSAASSLVHLAAGRADAVWSPGLQPWDGAAGVLLVLQSGGVVGDLDGPSGGRWPPSGDVLAAPASLWGPLRDLLASVYGRD